MLCSAEFSHTVISQAHDQGSSDANQQMKDGNATIKTLNDQDATETEGKKNKLQGTDLLFDNEYAENRGKNWSQISQRGSRCQWYGLYQVIIQGQCRHTGQSTQD